VLIDGGFKMSEANSKDRLLNERESAILSALVSEYILAGKPVGSRSFVQKYSFSISPATMRNIMFDLESMGYLMQPHTSAGRIPTDMGYRFYVDALLDSYDFILNDSITVNEAALSRELQLDKVFCSITRMLSAESKYAGIMLTPKPDFTVVKRIELIPVSINEILVILITRTGMLITRKVKVSENRTLDDLHDYSRYLTETLCGYSLFEIKKKVFEILRIEGKTDLDKQMALDIAELALTEDEEPELHIDGIENLLKIPEMVEAKRLNSLLQIIEEKNILRSIMEKTLSGDGVLTLIGDEIDNARVFGCSMVTTSYKIGNSKVGVIGVFGPTRMDYEKVVPLIDYTGKAVTDLLTKMSV